MPTSAATTPPSLTPENLRELQTAKQSLRKVRRAVNAAKFEGYTIAICGGLSFLFGIGSIGDMLGGMVLTAIGIIEITGAGRLGRLDVKGARIVAVNQLCLAALIFLYAVWSLHAEAAHPASDLPDLSPSDVQALGSAGDGAMDLTHEIMMLLYGSLIIAAIAEAGMAAYYNSRGAYLQQYLSETPEWIVNMQKSGISI
jgi:hypothetical protein